MSLEALVSHYGLAAIYLGAGLEGEAAVVAGGLLAHQGLVSLPGAIVAVILGSFTADQLWFQAGRRFRDHRWVARARATPTFAKALGALERHPVGFIFAFRFIYGFRTISPIAIGTSAVKGRTFLLVNAVAAIVWGTTFTVAGYLFGNGIERLFGRFRPHGHQWLWLAGGCVVIGLVAAAVYRWRRNRAAPA